MTAERAAVIAAARSASADAEVARVALKLGPRSIEERLQNLEIAGGPTLPAIDRYTGVLYDPLQACTADPRTRAWLYCHVIVQSAMFGPLRAADRIPSYRLSHDSKLEGLRLPQHWSRASSAVLEQFDGLVLDLRSEGYRALGPVASAVPIRIVSVERGGRRRALNHWNKTAKGRLVAALAQSEAEPSSLAEFMAWAHDVGIVIDRVDGVVEMIAESLSVSAEAGTAGRQ